MGPPAAAPPGAAAAPPPGEPWPPPGLEPYPPAAAPRMGYRRTGSFVCIPSAMHSCRWCTARYKGCCGPQTGRCAETPGKMSPAAALPPDLRPPSGPGGTGRPAFPGSCTGLQIRPWTFLLSHDAVGSVPPGGLAYNVEIHCRRQGRMLYRPHQPDQGPMEQIGGQGIRPRPGPGEPTPGTPAQNQKPQCQSGAVASQSYPRVTGSGVIEDRNRQLRLHQKQCPQGHRSEPVPGHLRRQQDSKPEVRKKDDGPAQGPCPPNPAHPPGQTAQHHRQDQHRPSPPPAQPQQQRRRHQPEAQAQQIPQHPPGGVPPGLPQEKGDALTAQIHRGRPPQLPQTPCPVVQKKPRQKSKQGHVKPVDQPVEPIQRRIRADPRLNPVPENHQPDQQQLQVAVIRIAKLDHFYALLYVGAGTCQNVTAQIKESGAVSLWTA